MSNFLFFILIVFVISFGLFAVDGLKCYTGFALIRGQSVGTTFEVCSSPDDYCYRAHADINILSTIKKAGCSTYRCMFNQNKCIKQNFAGTDVEFCCCNQRDLCNHSISFLSFNKFLIILVAALNVLILSFI